MKIIIAGAGSVGRYMAEQLSKFGHDIVLIDTSAKAVGRVDNQSGNIVGLVGDGCEVSTLANAGAKDAGATQAQVDACARIGIACSVPTRIAYRYRIQVSLRTGIAYKYHARASRKACARVQASRTEH